MTSPLIAARKVGILGGSFNPAHEGHLHISRVALARLDLDQVWWMVSPQNPLKPVKGMGRLAERLAAARRLAADPRIRVTGIEETLGTRYTVDTLRALRVRFPRTRFVWIMGADNLIQIVRWKRWQSIFHIVPIAVFARPSYSLKALSDTAAQRFRHARLRQEQASVLVSQRPPAWAFVNMPQNAASATRIRKSRGRRD